MKKVRAIFTYIAGIDPEYLFADNIWLPIKHILVGASGFTTTVFFSRLASRETFGLYSLVLSIFQIGSAFAFSGVTTAIIVSVTKGFDRSYWTGTKIRFISSLVLSLVLFLISLYFWSIQKETLSSSLIIAAIWFPLINTTIIYEPMLLAKKIFKIQALAVSATNIIPAIAVLGGLLLRFDIITIIFFYFSTTAFLNLLFNRYSQKFISNKSTNDQKFITNSFFMTLISVVAMVSTHLDKLILGFLSGFTSLAVYLVALVIPEGVSQLIKNSMEPFTVRLAGKDKIRQKRIIRVFYLRLILLGAILSLLLWIILPIIVPLIFTSNYSEATIAAQLLGLKVLFTPLSVALSSIIVFSMNYRNNILINLFPQLIKICLYLLLIPFFGLYGIIMTIIIERIVSTFLLTYLLFN